MNYADGVDSTSEEVQVDPDGDLVLRAGQQTGLPERSFRVCANALRRSSQVWKKMLFGPFKESKPAFGTWLVHLPDDDPDALEIVLNIIHANFPLVPATPGLAELYEIFQMANKYDMVPALKPWANAWLDVAESCAAVTDGESMAALTYVAWELGQVELHRKMMKELLLYSSIDGDGRMVTADGVVLDDSDPIGPPGLLGFLRKQHQEIFNTLPSQLNDVIAKLTTGPGCCVDKKASSDERADCNDIILGSLVRGMAKTRGSISLTMPVSEGESVAKFAGTIRTIAEGISSHEQHGRKCNPAPRIIAALNKFTRGRVVKLTKMSVEKMEVRREELGLDKPRSQKPSEWSLSLLIA
ncbi:uncharacterized protein GLRG_11540 [Colletotrichum graminicola M1.001]|uniref:Nuclear pore protein n=1 Tax=Colletotrichum graminicola (strain M1.001 / M2 / FGSC 10212) TaxID=645133 RepID=E3QZX4_COLGM|nr:uncharacterized protein GLRG_11540 [Colletotrichum graminicola M1.001]EFQ36412.1 hypothetical protein GLRG_11540 [Colletotrichum graminicola M1.001]